MLAEFASQYKGREKTDLHKSGACKQRVTAHPCMDSAFLDNEDH